jgi:hypothetical protein
MSSAVPFTKYKFDAALMGAMREAFHKVFAALELSCGAEDPFTETVVTSIVAYAKAGASNPDVLADLVLRDLKRKEMEGPDLSARSPTGSE